MLIQGKREAVRAACVAALVVATMRCAPSAVPARHGGPAAGARGLEWVEVGSVPGSFREHRPQGMALAGRFIVFTKHRHDTGSGLFRFDRDTFEPRGEAQMPAEATHTGGLAYDGVDLWAVDYNSNRIYRIDLERTFQSGVAAVVESYPTGLRGTSALAFLVIDGVELLAISDFGVPGVARTYLVQITRLSELEHRPIREVAEVSYDNGAFSQGLAWDGACLYEGVNAFGRDEVRVLDVRAAVLARDASRIVEVGRFPAPATAIEDLEIDGDTIWTSDEGSFRFYRATMVSGLRDRLARSEVHHATHG